MNPNEAEVEKILESLDSKEPLDVDRAPDQLKILELYECWEPFFSLLDQLKESRRTKELRDYLWMFRVQLDYREDVGMASSLAVKMVKELGLGYADFKTRVLDWYGLVDDFESEGKILHSILNCFKGKEDRTECLERLCLIHEKKKYDEELLHECFQELIAVDPQNIKALKFFKNLHIQQREFESVVGFLEKIHAATKHPEDKFRVALELATTYLYQVGSPSKAIEVVNQHCSGSHLDTSSLKFEAFYQMEQWQNCSDVLEECLRGVLDDKSQSILHFKIGEIQELLKNPSEAKLHYEKALSCDEKFLEPFESLIYLAVEESDWQGTIDWLTMLEERVVSSELKRELTKLREEITYGLDNAS